VSKCPTSPSYKEKSQGQNSGIFSPYAMMQPLPLQGPNKFSLVDSATVLFGDI
jgi:hypothetical protein